MTAEQALIEENKKDPRVRYITEDAKLINLWSIKPFFDSEFNVWVGKKVTLISSLKYQNFSDFKDKDSIDCILCIDDIKLKVPSISEKWYIGFDNDNFYILNSWRLKKATHYLKGDDLTGCFLLSNDFFKDGSFYVAIGQSIPENYQKITLEQFKKYVLESKENQELNSSLNSIDSYEKSGSIGSVEFSGKYIKTGRIESLDFNGNPFTSITNNSSLEFYPTRCWIEDRINYINQFIKRTIDSDLCINPEWISERNELIEKLKNLENGF